MGPPGLGDRRPLSPASRNVRRQRPAFLSGALRVGGGLVVLGVSSYGFLTISARAMGAQPFSSLLALWALALVVGTGFFFPFEQELARRLTARRAAGLGDGGLVGHAIGAALGISLVLVAGVLLARPVLMEELFDGDGLLLAGLVLSILGLCWQFLVRGSLLGNERFSTYGLVLACEGLVRLIGAIALFVAGVSTPGAYGLLVGVAPLLSSLVGYRILTTRGLPGPPTSRSEVLSDIGVLLLGSLLLQLLLNLAPVITKALTTDAQEASASGFLAGLVLARVPLFLFTAILASTLPRLSYLVTKGDKAAFVGVLRRVTTLVGGLGILGTLATVAVGPPVVRAFYGPGFDVSRSHLGFLAASSAAQMLALTLAAALIALSGHLSTAAGWGAGLAVLGAVTAVGGEVLARVERGLLAGSLVAFLTLAVILGVRLGAWSQGTSHDEGEILTLPSIEP